MKRVAKIYDQGTNESETQISMNETQHTLHTDGTDNRFCIEIPLLDVTTDFDRKLALTGAKQIQSARNTNKRFQF